MPVWNPIVQSSRGARFRIYFKKQIRVDHLDFQQTQMLKLGNVLLSSRKEEISRGLNARGSPARPLTARYARRKSRLTHRAQGFGRNVRDLMLTGKMLREWLVRTVSKTQAISSWSTRMGRIKAKANNDREEFIAVSRQNQTDVLRAGVKVLGETSKRIVLERFLNG